MFIIHSNNETTGERLVAKTETLQTVQRGLKNGVRRMRAAGVFIGLDGFDQERALWEQIEALTENGGDVGPLPDGTKVTVTVE